MPIVRKLSKSACQDKFDTWGALYKVGDPVGPVRNGKRPASRKWGEKGKPNGKAPRAWQGQKWPTNGPEMKRKTGKFSQKTISRPFLPLSSKLGWFPFGFPIFSPFRGFQTVFRFVQAQLDPNPKSPMIKKFQDLRPGLKVSSEIDNSSESFTKAFPF